jgi:hypothetical protein
MPLSLAEPGAFGILMEDAGASLNYLNLYFFCYVFSLCLSRCMLQKVKKRALIRLLVIHASSIYKI